MRVLPALLATGIMLAVASCGDDDADGDAPTVAALNGRTFTSTAVEGWTLVNGTEMTLTFEDDGVAASAGCNTLSGEADVAEGALQVSTLASTMMACDGDLPAQDEWLTAFLEAGPRITLDGDTLTLATADATVTAQG